MNVLRQFCEQEWMNHFYLSCHIYVYLLPISRLLDFRRFQCSVSTIFSAVIGMEGFLVRRCIPYMNPCTVGVGDDPPVESFYLSQNTR